MVECGGLENRFTRNPGDEGSNPSSSAIMHRVNEPEWLVFLYVDHGSRPTGVVAPAGVLSGCAAL